MTAPSRRTLRWGDSTIYFDTGGGCCDFSQRISKNITTFPGVTDAASYLSSWRHFVIQKNGDKKEIWIDGQLYHEGINIAALPSNFSLLAIGSDSGGGDNTHGDLDDFAVFASALTPAEIGKLFTGTPPDQIRPVTASAAKFTKFTKNANGTFTIEWTGGGTLQAAPAVNGPWADVPGAASPFTFPPSGAALFGRVRN